MKSKKKILIFGSSGLLGNYFFKKLKKNFRVFGCQHKNKNNNFFNIDISYIDQTTNIIKKTKPDIIINCIGYTDVIKCEINKIHAIKLNTLSVYNIISSLKSLKKKTHLIHISTDQMYNNKNLLKKNFEKEINPINFYGITKMLGENQTLNYKRKTIIRTNFFGKTTCTKNSYSDFLIFNLKRKKNLKIPKNVYFNPVSMEFLRKLLVKIILKKVYGTYNIGANDGVSKYDFAKKLAKIKKLNINYIAPFKSVQKIHKKPLGTILSVKKIKRRIKINVPKIEDFLKEI